MIEVIRGDSNTFAAHAYGVVDQMTIDWCNQRANNVLQSMIPEARQMFNEYKGTVFDSIDYSHVARLAKAASRSIGALFQEQSIRLLTTIAELQHPPEIMVDWLMANPEINQLHRDQLIDGYQGRYVNQYEAFATKENPYYQAVVAGVFMPTGNGDEEIAIEYITDVADTDIQPLDLHDKVSIIESWNHLLTHIKANREDPTSKFNAML